MFERAEAEFAGAQLLQLWHQASWVRGKVASGDLLELTSQRKPQQEEQGAAANSELFALPWLPGAQAPSWLTSWLGGPRMLVFVPERH